MIRVLTLLLFSNTLSAQLLLPMQEVPSMTEEVYELIKTKHYVGSTTEGRAALDAARTRVLGKVIEAMDGRDSIPYYEFTAIVAPLQQVTQCGHLLLRPYRDSLTDKRVLENRFPVQFFPLDSGATNVLYSPVPLPSGDTLPAGTIVEAVDGIPTAELLPRLAVFGGLNDRGNDYVSLFGAGRGFSPQYQRYYGVRDSIVLTDDTGAQHVVYPTYQPFVNPKEKVGKLDDVLSSTIDSTGQTVVLSISTFSDVKFNDGNYFRWIRAKMEQLNEENIPNLIIDLRGNTGGSNERINYLYSCLSPERFRFADAVRMTGPEWAQPGESAKITRRRANGAVSKRNRRIQKYLQRPLKPQKDGIRYDGRVVVLVDELTFSASGMFARFVQGSGRGILIGSPTGAGADVTYGGRSSKVKPKNLIGVNEDFNLSIHNIQLTLPHATPGTVTPDIIVPVTREDLLAGRDAVLEAALAYLADE